MVLFKDRSQLAYSVILPDKAETTVSFLISYPPNLFSSPHSLSHQTPSLSFCQPFTLQSHIKIRSTPLTVIQEVDSSSLESNYQSFASLMEQRLAELFLVAGRQGSQIVRSRRATTVAGCTVQVHTHLLFALPSFVGFALGFILR